MENERIAVSIITIGDELMIGQVIDTNSAWIAQQLNAAGIWVKRRVAVGDSRSDIWKALDEEGRHSQIILITGGLGPTADDITKPLLSEYFGGKLITDTVVLKHVEQIFTRSGRPFTERNIKQAEVPENCEVLFNERGTAPGMWFEKEGRIYVSMPGVPYEMKGLMTGAVIPRLLKRFNPGNIIHQTLLTTGIGESFLADHIAAWESRLPAHIRLSYLPNFGMIRLRLTGLGADRQKLSDEMAAEFEKLKQLTAQWLAADEDITMPQLVTKMLRERKKRLSTAESCTGGYIAHLITGQPGSSDVYNGSVVSYTNDLKKKLLHVEEDVLSRYGAVSEAIVRQMAKGVLEATDSDYAIAVSGIMGPGGGSPEKPVGMVWVAAGDRQGIIAREFRFRHDRIRNIEHTANHALNLLRKYMLDGPSS
ncbi:MAG TPA: CinA family nicotinamide mononucleotide deamidase-related protein [Flavitalea sp.]|nr:CinA family nicotinamide mononucleotide deamidase-related protein [Flavitalea sp.]